MQFRPEGDEGLCFVETRLEFADVSRVVGAFGFEDAYFDSQFLELGVVWGRGGGGGRGRRL